MIIHRFVKLHFTPGHEYPTDNLNSWMPLQRSWGGSRTPSLYSRKDRPFTKNLSCYSDLALNWRGLKFTDCVAPYDDEDEDDTNMMQSQTQLVTSPIALQQLILTPAHSVVPQKLAMSALEPRVFRHYSTAASASCLSCDARDLLCHLRRTSHPCLAFRVHQCLAPMLPPLLIFLLLLFFLPDHLPAQIAHSGCS